MKAQIKEEALKLILKYGPHNVTLDDIIWEMRSSKSTFYKFYKSKDELIAEVFNGLIDKTLLEIELLIKSGKSAYEKAECLQQMFFSYLSGLTQDFVYQVKKYYPSLVAKYRKFRDSHIIPALRGFLKEARKEGQIDGKVDLDIFINTQIVCFEEALFGRLQVLTESREKIKEYGNHIVIHNTRGILNPGQLPLKEAG